jgi:hypothetical protein
MKKRLTVFIFLMVFIYAAHSEGLAPGLRLSALWNSDCGKPGGEAALLLQKALTDRIAVSLSSGYSLACYGLSSDADEELRLYGPSFSAEGKVLLLSFLSVSGGAQWHYIARGEYIISESEAVLNKGDIQDVYGGMIIGFQFLLDDHYRLEGRLFRSFDDIIDSEGSLGHASLKPAYFSIGFSFYF